MIPGPLALAACLTLGALTGVLVAWLVAALAIRAEMYGRRASASHLSVRARDPQRGEGEGIFQVSYARRFGVTNWSVLACPPREPGGRAPDHADPEALIPRWASDDLAPYLENGAWPAPGATELRRVWSAGWPFRALHSRQPVNDGSWVPFQGQLYRKLPFGLTPGDAAVTPLPRLPVWHGLVLNTAFYGAGWWCVVLGLLAVRGRFRRRGGYCPRCAYDLRGTPRASVCPECGGPLSSPGGPLDGTPV